MPELDFAAADRIWIECPACGAREAADPAVLSGAPMIVCRKCGETWPISVQRKARRLGGVAETGAGKNVIEAERRPLVTFSTGVGAAWAAKMAADAVAEPAPPSRVTIAAAALLSAAFLVAFVAAREQAVAMLPDLAGLYATIGLPVNVDKLIIEGVAAERSGTGEEIRIIVRGAIRNVGSTAKPVPPLTVSFRDTAMAPAGRRGFDPPSQLIAAGEAAPFVLEIDDAPRQAADVVLKFRSAAEQAPENESNLVAP